ncbi:DMT family transporter [Streptomyces sp. JJ36]|uniref:DMT family transporter n=1 Tax=Streptomyces sp. JJ36 TaxID=2736645 RepID=UPI001F1B3242|nr:DMT family transporter [Streptomyces sp. JJ36]MCF6521998.1 DMT family transporter [Streptomyces sp. JJ36]
MSDTLLIAVPASLAAGSCFALAGVLQQHSAAARPERESLSYQLLLHLARQPVWLTGIGLAVLAYVFQGVALAHGPLSLVQPLIVTELIFAIPLSARLHRMRLGRREWLGVGAVTVGLTAALYAAQPQGGDPRAGTTGWLLSLSVMGGLVLTVLAASRHVGEAPRASLLALAGGLVMGTQSVLLDATIDLLDEGPGVLFTAWQTYLMVAASITGLLLIQSAFQAGPLAASVPVFDAAEPAVAIGFGIGLFGESVQTGWVALPVAAVGVALLFAGIVLLDTSPLLAALHQRERNAEVHWPTDRS